MNTVLMLMLWFVALAYAASVGFRGRATHPDYYGARVSDTVKSTPRLRARANRSVGIWCTVSSMMAVVPIVWIGSDFHRERTTWELAGLAASSSSSSSSWWWGVTRWRRSRSRDVRKVQQRECGRQLCSGCVDFGGVARKMVEQGALKDPVEQDVGGGAVEGRFGAA